MDQHGELGLESGSARQHNLDDLVTRIAVRLMPVASSTLQDSLAWAIEELGRFFGVDTAFLRRHDHERGLSVLLAEWPHRYPCPDPDPLGEVPFAADPVFAASQHLRHPMIVRPTEAPDYQQRVGEASGLSTVAMATVPLVHDEVTEGVLGFVSFAGRDWSTPEINALQAIASLLLQLQARIAAEERLLYNALHDELTGLANRRAVLARLEEALAGPSPTSVGVLFIDLDRMKLLNDALGHRMGDRLLVALGARLSAATRRQDLVGRMGGDEFVVILGEPIDPREALQIAGRLQDVLNAPCEIEGQVLTRTSSIGISLGRAGEIGAEQLVAEADAAMYAAKARGRNQAVVFDDQLRAAANSRFELEQQLRAATETGGLRLHYQPEIDLVTGEMLAVEALLRWEHPTRGLLAAGAFIEVAEESGLIVSIGRWVLDEATRQAAEWQRRHPGRDLVVRVNVSPAQLLDADMAGAVAATLVRHGVRPPLLCLEITEHAVVEDLELVAGALSELRASGVHIAIDDFGTGYSSMTQLKRLPADTLKIDHSFVAGLGHDERDEAIVQATVALANSLGMELVAEGVETASHAERLRQLGCRRAQGYFFARPMPPQDIDELLAVEERPPSDRR